jgi:HEAT repeat protein
LIADIDFELSVAVLQYGDAEKQQAAARALGRSQDPRAVEPLLAALKDPLKDSGYYSLKDSGYYSQAVRQAAAEALGTLGDQKAVQPLTALLTDRRSNEEAAHALVALGWTPQSDSDRIHLLVAQKAGHALRAQWELTKRVLLKDLESGTYEAQENAMQALLSIGNWDIVPVLIELLNKRGAWDGVSIANWCLKSGNSDLEAAARAWAQKTPGVTVLHLDRRAEPGPGGRGKRGKTWSFWRREDRG